MIEAIQPTRSTELDCSALTGLKRKICEGWLPQPDGTSRQLSANERARLLAVITGEPIPPELPEDVRKQKRINRKRTPRTAAPANPPIYNYEYIGAGSALHDLLETIHIREWPGCNCRAKAEEMDLNGLRWCRKHFTKLATWLAKKGGERVAQNMHIGRWIPQSIRDGAVQTAVEFMLQKAIEKATSERDARVGPLDLRVGVTTAPRGGYPLLDRCLASLVASGFDPGSITVYAEPGSHPSERRDVRTVTRTSRLGAWRNWMQTLQDLLSQDADVIMIVQDDTVFSRGVRDFLSAALWPAYDCAAIQLCCSSYYQNQRPGIRPMTTVGMLGAWATVMHRFHAQQIYEYGMRRGWRGRHTGYESDPVKKKAIDDYIGHTAHELGYRCYVTFPSVVLHDADVSSLNHGDSKGRKNNRKTRGWIGHDQLALDHVPLLRERATFQL